MNASVIVFPGSNCDRDVARALEAASGRPPRMVWHGETELPPSDLIVLPGGFSYGDYLRAGAMAAHSPIMRAVVERARDGVPVLGICNGFQILTETGLLPGALMRNASLKFICKDVYLRVESTETLYTRPYRAGQVVRFPVAHHDGNYFADPATLRMLEGEGRVIFRYCDADGNVTAAANPNGSQDNIAGICSADGRVLGLMPHPERLADPVLGGTDGFPMFRALAETLTGRAGADHAIHV
ncbi:phosphoribosylformylglycinamidine synthase subunit PurQ [Dichotomicrobium thermohalophilum]|uniref:Phosphoribosylformylglycinamidine synthase subunit PurQ n=1 Tax=Dichotomicrobium thermohalophilum TaxID=933063 RepID=A0A397Q6E4_9HYPH|nr:phosphoribosylformylglycinamidine synthase subunit PurQ [Dichotomicrobium thermohalophilum]RIA55107.1 phosphoribosylformylglycinamidine synthase [Dichotomicrobium thermohalophilum]